jgi:hypothetical protein
VRANWLSGPAIGILRDRQGVGMRKPVTGQYKVNLDSGQVYIVRSQARTNQLRRHRPAYLIGLRTR